jgi:hypothetical protein
MRTGMMAVAGGLMIVCCYTAVARAAEPTKAEELPIKEVAVFKDGHAFVTHVGQVAVTDGQAHIEHLPSPVLGTFWASGATEGVRITEVSASQVESEADRPALTIRDLLKANVGAHATIAENRPGEAGVHVYDAEILAIPEHETTEQTVIPASWQYDPRWGQNIFVPQRTITTPKTVAGDVVLLKTEDGVRAVPVAHITDITFPDQPSTTIKLQEKHGVLRLRIEGTDADSAEVVMAYLQKGLRWIPEYALELGDDGQLRIRLQATLINELADLHDATVYLVVGVPSFVMAGELSPLALQQTARELGQYFERSGGLNPQLRGALMSQSADLGGAYSYPAGAPPAAAALPGEALVTGPVEDLFVYRLDKVSLKQGERMVVPVIAASAKYEDVYLWYIPCAPPAEMLQQLSREERTLLARSSELAHLQHALRIRNESAVPWTTGPALVFRDGRPLGQGLMNYTSVGNSSDVVITAAADIHTRRSDRQAGFTPDALQMQHRSYAQVDFEGKLTLTNYKDQTVHVEVCRAVLGQVDQAGQDGQITQLNWMEDWSYLPNGQRGATLPTPVWFWRYDWPWWWSSLNGVGQITWTFELQPDEAKELTYAWHYFTQ